MVEGKHEVWANMLYKVLNDLAEVLQEKDIVLLLDEISTIKEVDLNILTLLTSLGRNTFF